MCLGREERVYCQVKSLKYSMHCPVPFAMQKGELDHRTSCKAQDMRILGDRLTWREASFEVRFNIC